MSRIGKQVITIPQGVTATLLDGIIVVRGPKGELKRKIHPCVSVMITDSDIRIDVVNKEDKAERSLWGTFGAHIKNMITGVVSEFSRQLEINGVGYKIALQGKDIKIEVGYSHPVLFPVPEGITASIEKNIITIQGPDKEQVGKVASEIRAIRTPEPYKGKGIKYVGEVVRRKAGKAAKAAGA